MNEAALVIRSRLAAVLLVLLSCERSKVDPLGAPPRGDPSAPQQLSKPGLYSSSADRFSVAFPFNGVPKAADLLEQQTVIGPTLATSYYVRLRDVAFDVQVTRYPANSLAHDVPGLLKAERDGALVSGNVRLVHERRTHFRIGEPGVGQSAYSCSGSGWVSVRCSCWGGGSVACGNGEGSWGLAGGC